MRAPMAAASNSGRRCRLGVSAAQRHAEQSKVEQRPAQQRSPPT